MSFVPGKKTRRTPLHPDQVKEIILRKKKREYFLIQKFKKTKRYKALNIFNILCVLVYSEIIFCIYGPARYENLICEKVSANYGPYVNGKATIRNLLVYTNDGKTYLLSVDEYIQLPRPNTVFYLGKDYLLNKEIKAMVSTSSKEYRLRNDEPLIFLGIFVTLITMFVFYHNMNMINYSLTAVSIFNGLIMLYFIFV